MPTVPTVFISYSHKDEDWKDRLLDHLGGLEEEGLLQTWNDRNIGAGDEWFEGIRNAMDGARVAVLLVSAHSLKSKFIRHTEIPHLLERRTQAGMVFFPVIVKACVWEDLPWLSRFQARPIDGKPLAGFQGNRRDAELAKIAKEILGIVRNGAPRSQPPKPPDPPKLTTLVPLHQLPTPPADFTGRQEDLDFLRSRLAQGGAGAIFGLRGMGGVGKTTLALKLAAELKPRFPDAQIYLDLKGVDPRPLTSAQAMAHVIRAFHPDNRLPESDTELSGLYRSVLDGKRVLLFMDNAARKEQIEPLIPPPTCLLLVTSRFRFALPGLVDRDLDELSEKDARDLLLKIAPRIGDAADEIARLCGRLPLALRLAGSALAERLNLSPSEYIRRFQEGKERFSEVDASLNLSYELLDKERQRLWRSLAVFPGTFGGTAAAAVWDLAPDSAQDALGELVRRSLVEWKEKEERYRLHDLARAFAADRLEAGEREAGQRRLAKHFLEVLRAADALYIQGGASIQAALRLFDAEWGNIQAGHAWAATRPPGDTIATRICDEYPHAGAYVLLLRQPALEQIRWRELGLAAAQQRKDRESEGNHLGNLGIAYKNLGETRRAIQLYEQQLAIAREIGDRRGEGAVLGNMGLAYSNLGETRRAIELYEQALIINREIGNRRGEGAALGNMGNAYAALGETRRALEIYEQALIIDREIGNRRGEGNVFGNMGNAYVALGETRRAIELYKQQLAIAREIGDRRGEGNACWNLGLAYEAEGDLARAAKLMQVMVDFEREIGHSDAEKHAARVEALRARIAEQASDNVSAP
jgi:tetratricopeptide (TPR) repeat protein